MADRLSIEALSTDQELDIALAAAGEAAWRAADRAAAWMAAAAGAARAAQEQKLREILGEQQ